MEQNTGTDCPFSPHELRQACSFSFATTGFSLYLDSASSAGQVINASLIEQYGKSAQSAEQTQYASHQSPPSFLFALPHNLTYAQNFQRDRKRCLISHVASSSPAYMYSLLLRKNSFYRSRVAKIIHSFRLENRFNASTSCVAVTTLLFRCMRLL
jgi:hypothetical protein